MERMAGWLGCHECGASYDACDKADCPICGQIEPYGHAPDCRLAAAMEKEKDHG